MDIYITKTQDATSDLKDIIKDYLKLSDAIAQNLTNQVIKPHIDQLKDDISLVIETDYVDKVYRDSYYHYYSSKMNTYNRDCIKISLFSQEILATTFDNIQDLKTLKDSYLGYFLLRPTEPQIIGRSVISPAALKTNNILMCAGNFSTTANSIKLEAIGFPHSSQDGETLTCAETTIWAVMEYFGNKYPEYRPILPSKILSVLKHISHQRQLPSIGLQIEQISYSLREFGFGSKIYSREEYKSEFEKLLSCYIESGVPLIIAIDNLRHKATIDTHSHLKYIGHAVLCIGHVQIEEHMIDSIPNLYSTYSDINNLLAKNNVKIYDLDDIKKQFVFIDDNCPIYQKAFLNTPTVHYSGLDQQSWHLCEVSHFIVPLYKKIYLEAYQAKNFIIGFILGSPFALDINSEVTLRTFLTSSRSYKQYILTNQDLTQDAKSIILEEKMPKFIWVAELSTKQLIKQNKINGLVLLDATEPNTYNFEPLILAMYSDSIVKYSEITRFLEKNPLPLPPFDKFDENLNHIS